MHHLPEGGGGINVSPGKWWVGMWCVARERGREIFLNVNSCCHVNL